MEDKIITCLWVAVKTEEPSRREITDYCFDSDIKLISFVKQDHSHQVVISRGSKYLPFYIHKDNWTLHSGYPTTEENLVTDKATQVYLLDRIERYKKDCEFNLMQANNILDKIKFE